MEMLDTKYAVIIPYQELLGNYNRLRKVSFKGLIIPYQELLGNYNSTPHVPFFMAIIPYQELLGNYNLRGTGWRRRYIIPY